MLFLKTHRVPYFLDELVPTNVTDQNTVMFCLGKAMWPMCALLNPKYVSKTFNLKALHSFREEPQYMNTARLELVSDPNFRQSAHLAHEIPMQPASYDIWDKKYRLKAKNGDAVDHSIDDTFRRVAKALSEVEATPELQKHWQERFFWALRHGAIPAGRVTSNAGALAHKPATSTINCTVSGTIVDSMDDILEKVHEAGLTLKAGCGIGRIIFPEIGFQLFQNGALGGYGSGGAQ